MYKYTNGNIDTPLSARNRRQLQDGSLTVHVATYTSHTQKTGGGIVGERLGPGKTLFRGGGHGFSSSNTIYILSIKERDKCAHIWFRLLQTQTYVRAFV